MRIKKHKCVYFFIPTIVYSRYFYLDKDNKCRYIDIKFLNYELTFKF